MLTFWFDESGLSAFDAVRAEKINAFSMIFLEPFSIFLIFLSVSIWFLRILLYKKPKAIHVTQFTFSAPPNCLDSIQFFNLLCVENAFIFGRCAHGEILPAGKRIESADNAVGSKSAV